MRRTTVRALGAGAGVLIGIGVFVSVANLAGSGDVDVRLGDDEFVVGPAEQLAAAIERDDRPLLFQDLLVGGQRDIWVQHLAADPDAGWVAFDARLAGQPRSCTLEWVADDGRFVDPCDGTVVPADGGDQPGYPTRVDDDGLLVVDLTPEGRPGRGTTTSTTAPSAARPRP
ncbi:MAG: hypothetical protein IPM45_08290 [Acidimicrobiales bacterium]|nr:hypothetical protein [Acidimicrobiales bacterium]